VTLEKRRLVENQDHAGRKVDGTGPETQDVSEERLVPPSAPMPLSYLMIRIAVISLFLLEIFFLLYLIFVGSRMLSGTTQLLLLTPIFLMILLAVSYMFVKSANDRRDQLSEELFEARKRIAAEPGSGSVYESPALREWFDRYRNSVLRDARNWGLGSFAAAALGLIWIVVYATFVASTQTSNLQAALSALPSLIIQGVSLLFFKESRELRKLAGDLNRDLTQTAEREQQRARQTDALKEARHIKDPQIRAAVEAHIALNMAGTETAPLDLMSLSLGQSTDKTPPRTTENQQLTRSRGKHQSS
jgi:hypothetical protein